MGLKFTDAVRLSWTNVTQHKKQSAILVFTISLLFGIIVGINFVISGLEKTVVESSVEQTKGVVYMTVGASTGSSGGSSGRDAHSLAEISRADLKPTVNEKSDELVRARVAEYGGEIIGYQWFYQLDYPYHVIDKSAVGSFINDELLKSLPEGMAPVLMPEGWKPHNADDSPALMARLDGTLYRVGEIPNTEVGHPTLEGFQPLNMILKRLPDAVNDDFWIVDDGSGKALSYIRNQLKTYLSEEGSWYSIRTINKTPIARFDDPAKAAEFVQANATIVSPLVNQSETKYSSGDIFGTTASVAFEFKRLRTMVMLIEIVLLAVAVIITVFSFAHLIDDDAKTVALYRAMGASTDGIYVIYLCYLVELCLLAIVATVVIGLLIAGGVAAMSAGKLSARLTEFYGLSTPPKVRFVALTPNFWGVLGIILCIAPLSLLFTLRRFSATHLAKKLKED